jgi:sugar lactone lactonase YvrE
MKYQNLLALNKKNLKKDNLSKWLPYCRNAFILFLVFMLSNCQPKQKEIQFPVKVGVKPESITKGFNGNYYVTVMNGDNPGDGELVEISPEGVKVFAKGFDQPKGIVFLNNNLYFSDLTRIWKVDSAGNASVFVDSTGFPKEVLYLNDVSLDAQANGIYVTDMGATKYMRDENNQLWPLESEQAKLVPPLGRIYHIDLAGKATLAVDSSTLMLNPNGVGIDNQGELMIGEFFKGNFLVKKNGQFVPLKGQFRGADAVEQDQNGNYYVSSWVAGTVWKIDGKTEEATVLIDGLKSAADFYLEEDKGRLLLPDMLEGVVYAVDINK